MSLPSLRPALGARLDPDDLDALRGHGVHAEAIVPGVAWILFALGDDACEGATLGPLSLHRPIDPASLAALRSEPGTNSDDAIEHRFTSGDATPVASIVRPGTEARPARSVVSDRTRERASVDPYPIFDAAGNDYRGVFRSLSDVSVNDDGGAARLRALPESSCSPFIRRVRALDAAVQLIGATRGEVAHPFVLESVRYVRLAGDPRLAASFECDVLEREAGGVREGRAVAFGKDGDVVFELDGVRLSELASHPEGTADRPSFGIAGTFTLEPLEPSLEFWASELGMPFSVRFAPYGQVFQALLDPGGAFRAEDSLANLSVLRIEDWAVSAADSEPVHGPERDGESLGEISEPARTDAPEGANVERYTLPNGLSVADVNRYETDYLYEEIFVDRVYLRHGISLVDARCVIDVGANIGMFSLFVHTEAPDAHVYAFEPGAAVFDALRTNLGRLGERGHAFNAGVAATAGEAVFTYYDQSTVFSTFAADADHDAKAIRAVVENMVVSRGVESMDAAELDDVVDGLVDRRLESQSMTVPLVALSDVIREHGIDRIDLLKVDAEKSELPILQGIADEHWPLIRQIVIEVHDTEGPLIREVLALLESRGFEHFMSEEALLENSGLYNIYAMRAGARSASGRSGPLLDASARRRIGSATDDWLSGAQAFARQSERPHLVTLAPMSRRLAESDDDRRFIESLERRIENACHDLPGTRVLDASLMQHRYGLDEFHDPVGDREGRVPFSPDWYAALATTAVRALHARSRPPLKVVVVDCDNTLWRGVCGELGPDGVVLDAAAEVLQRRLKALVGKGVLVCLASKNDEADVLETFARHPEFPLGLGDVVSHKIDWSPKPANLLALSRELELGLESFVFVDDNPVECATMRAERPEVVTIEFDVETGEEAERLIDHVWAFDDVGGSDVSPTRTQLYRDQAARRRSRDEAPTLRSFIESLELRVDITPASAEDVARVAELTLRTNQFNTSMVRRDADAVRSLIEEAEIDVLVVRVRDRFGDYGLVGAAVLDARRPGPLVVDSLLLSCRVLGRGVEHRVIAEIARLAVERGREQFEVPLVTVARNTPAREFVAALDGTSPQAREGDPAGDDVRTFRSAALVDHRFEPAADAAGTGSGAPVSTTGTSELGLAHAARASRIAAALNRADRILAAVGEAAEPRSRPDLPMPWRAPVTKVEKRLVVLFEDVLGMRGVGVDDNFFELGGRSLDAVRLVARARADGDVEVGITDIFARPSPRALADTGNGASPATSPRKRETRQRRRTEH